MKIKKILIACFAILLALLLNSGNGFFRYDNWVRKEDRITVSYSPEEIERISVQMSLINGGLYRNRLAERFDIECVRKTEHYCPYYAYYVIFAIDNGQYAYVIITSDMKVENCLIWKSEFRTKEEFESFYSQNQNIEDLREFNPNWFNWGFSSCEVVSFYVQEGIYTVTFDRVYKRTSSQFEVEYQAIGMEYVADEDYPGMEKHPPFILPVDKQPAK